MAARNKIGFHTGPGGNATGLRAWMTALDKAGIPFFIKSVDDAGGVVTAQEVIANQNSKVPHVLIYRRCRGVYGAVYDVPDYALSPEAAAEKHWALHKAEFPPELDTSRVWFETINEVDKARADWLGAFACRTAEIALDEGYKWAAFGWSAGEPEPAHWRTPNMLRYLRMCADHPDQLAVALHEYSFDVNDIKRLHPYLIGRFLKLFEICDEEGISRPTVLITEWGWGAFEVPPPERALDDIEWAAGLYAQYPQVLGAAIWYLGGGYGGIANAAQPLIAPLTDFTLEKTFSDVQPKPGSIETAALADPGELVNMTNQDVIDLFFRAFGVQLYADLMRQAGLAYTWQSSVARAAPYTGPAIDDMPTLTPPQRSALRQALPKIEAESVPQTPTKLEVTPEAVPVANVISVTPREEFKPNPLTKMTNQDVINLFFRAAGVREYAGWIQRAKLDYMWESDATRIAPYTGPAIEDMPKLTGVERDALREALAESDVPKPEPVPAAGVPVLGMNVNPFAPGGSPLPGALRDVSWVRLVFKVDAARFSMQEAFNYFDPLINKYANMGIKVLLILNQETYWGNAPWDNGDWQSYAEGFAARAAKIAAHYRGKVAAYEIWNEPDLENNEAAIYIEPWDFAKVLCRTALNIREQDPEAIRVSGGLIGGADNGTAYLQMVAENCASGRLPVEAIGAHPYGERPPEGPPFAGWGFGKLEDYVLKFKGAFPNKPLWFTEWGVPVSAPNEAALWPNIATYMRNVYNFIVSQHSQRVPVLIWFAWSDSMENSGIVDREGRPKGILHQTFFDLVQNVRKRLNAAQNAAASPPPATPPNLKPDQVKPGERLYGKGIWVWLEDELPVGLEMAKATEAAIILYKAGDGGEVYAHARDAFRKIEAAKRVPMAWAFIHLTNPRAEAQMVRAIHEMGYKGIVLDMEGSALDKAEQAVEFSAAVREAGIPPEQLYLTSFLNITTWQRIPYEEMLRLCRGGFMPQSYGVFNRSPVITLSETYEEHEKWSAIWGFSPPLYPILGFYYDNHAQNRATPQEAQAWLDELHTHDPRFFSIFRAGVTDRQLWPIIDGYGKPDVPQETATQRMKCVSQVGLNVRARPSTQSDLIDWIAFGRVVSAGETKETSGYTWRKIVGQEGWAAEVHKLTGQRYLVPIEETPVEVTPSEPEQTEKMRCIHAQWVNIRTAPRVSASKIGEIVSGQVVKVSDRHEADDYVWRKLSGMPGWVAVFNKAAHTPYFEAVGEGQTPVEPPGELTDAEGKARAEDFSRVPVFTHLPVISPQNVNGFGGFGPNNYSYYLYTEGNTYYNFASGLHNGIDFGLQVGVEVCAVDWGVVTHVSTREDDNPWAAGPFSVIVQYGQYKALYGHLRGYKQGRDIFVRKGDIVKPGQPLALSGVGNGYPHLHFEMRPARFNPEAWYINPAPFFAKKLETYVFATMPAMPMPTIDTDANGYPDRVILPGQSAPVAYNNDSVLSIPSSPKSNFWKGSRVVTPE